MKWKQMTPDEIADALRQRHLARERGEPLPLPSVPGPTWAEVLDAAVTNPTMYAALQTGRAYGYEGESLYFFMLLEVAKICRRLWDAYSLMLEQVPITYRLAVASFSSEDLED